VDVRHGLALLLVVALALAGVGAAAPLPGAPGCQILPRWNDWNQRVEHLPVTADSSTIIASIGLTDHMHADFGSGLWNGSPIGIPVTIVGASTPLTAVSFDYADESDPGPYPIPDEVRIEGGGDRHAVLVDRDACVLYELFALERTPSGGWHAGSGAIWRLDSNQVRPDGWTSADAAGLPILPGLARWGEVAQGRIDHALRFTASQTRRAYVWPARHYASSSTNPALPPMGLRVRLKAGYDISGFPPQSRVILQALKEYGMILADNGSDWYVSGAPNPGWSNDDLHSLHQVPGSAFEVVDSSLLTEPLR
jgi:hypothetical protein